MAPASANQPMAHYYVQKRHPIHSKCHLEVGQSDQSGTLENGFFPTHVGASRQSPHFRHLLVSNLASIIELHRLISAVVFNESQNIWSDHFVKQFTA